jgi:hypothetical protein
LTAARRSPRVTALAWGRVEVEGGEIFKDAKLYPGGARAWDWNETGTRHTPGILPGDVEELLEHGAQVVVLSRGQIRALRVADETLVALQERGVEVHVLPTKQAVRLYNRLRETRPVGALIHSTC